MLKFLGILVFIIVTSVAPYASAKSGNQTFAQNPETFDFNSANLLEEKLEPTDVEIDFSLVEVDYIQFPRFVLLKPQTIPDNTHKPPCSSSFT
jgi:hypothetical protein